MKNLKNEKGITLVALVVTIIVLLILAGVSLRLVAGNEGILSRSETAVKKSNTAQIKEEIDLALANAKMDCADSKYVNGNTDLTFFNYMKDVQTEYAKLTGDSVSIGSSDSEETKIAKEIYNVSKGIKMELDDASSPIMITIKFTTDKEYTKTIKNDDTIVDWTK